MAFNCSIKRNREREARKKKTKRTTSDEKWDIFFYVHSAFDSTFALVELTADRNLICRQSTRARQAINSQTLSIGPTTVAVWTRGITFVHFQIGVELFKFARCCTYANLVSSANNRKNRRSRLRDFMNLEVFFLLFFCFDSFSFHMPAFSPQAKTKRMKWIWIEKENEQKKNQKWIQSCVGFFIFALVDVGFSLWWSDLNCTWDGLLCILPVFVCDSIVVWLFHFHFLTSMNSFILFAALFVPTQLQAKLIFINEMGINVEIVAIRWSK